MKQATQPRKQVLFISVATALLIALPTRAQTLPPPPVSPAPVVNLEYDAQGNVKRLIQAPGLNNFSTSHAYDRLHRRTQTTDARSKNTQLDYNGREDLVQVTDPRSLVTQYPRNGLGDATSLVSPDTGTATHTFDAAGNLTTRLDARGVLASYAYDALNRLRSVSYSQAGQTSQVFVWTYDQTGPGFSNGIGRLTSTQFPGGFASYSYDPQGRLTASTQTVAASATVTLGVGYGYDAAGHLTSITYPSGRVLYIAHVGGQPTSLSLAPSAGAAALPLLGSLQFEPGPGGPVALRSWNWALDSGTLAHNRVFDVHGRMVRHPLGGAVRDISYDAADRIASFTHLDAASGQASTAAQALNQAFGYDEVGRLTGVITSGASWGYAYDDNGNRLSATLVTSTAAGTRTSSIAAGSNRLLGLSNPQRSFAHDAAGHTVTDQQSGLVALVATASYDASGRLSRLVRTAGTETLDTGYGHDAAGLRVLKMPLQVQQPGDDPDVPSQGGGGGSCTQLGIKLVCSYTGTALPPGGLVFVHDAQGQLLGEYDGTTGAVLREYVWLQGLPLVVVDSTPSSPKVFYVQTDHINTPRVMLDRAGRQRWSWVAEPFGVNAPVEDPLGFGPVKLNLRMPGQYFDEESGLAYNWHRSYDAGVGRYTQSDPIGLAGGINTYAYVEGNPVSKIDPIGLETYLCRRPLDGFHGISVGPLYHQFVCTLDAKGKVNCGGLGPRDGSNGMFGGPGVIEPEASVRPEQCEKVRDLDQCFETCVNDTLASPSPNYDVRAGRSWLFPSSNTQQCQVYAKSLLDKCSAQCRK